MRAAIGGAKTILDRPIVLFLIIFGFGAILAMPLNALFNDVITRIVIVTGLYVPLRDVVLPRVVAMVAVMLKMLGFKTTVYNFQLLTLTRCAHTVWVILFWNCIGWQTFILLSCTLVFGISGSYTRLSKLICIALGLQSTILISYLRILLVSVVAFFWGTLPAITFHEYGGTVLVLFYLFLFWYVSFKWILVKALPVEDVI